MYTRIETEKCSVSDTVFINLGVKMINVYFFAATWRIGLITKLQEEALGRA